METETEEHWPERFCECEQCREWYREREDEWSEYDETNL
jgi:hypothetical protein